MKNRKRNRLIGFDYSKDAIYFITICCKNRTHHFGEIINHSMQLNEYGKIASEQIEWLENQYPYIIIHNFVIMPNHVHILLEIIRDSITPVVGTGRDLSLQQQSYDLSLPKIKSISSLMGAYKTTSSKKIHLLGNQSFLWQRSFHDHIVRNQTAFLNIDNYISENPYRWSQDTFNKDFNPNFKEDE